MGYMSAFLPGKMMTATNKAEGGADYPQALLGLHRCLPLDLSYSTIWTDARNCWTLCNHLLNCPKMIRLAINQSTECD